jgi:hypothetical protein
MKHWTALLRTRPCGVKPRPALPNCHMSSELFWDNTQHWVLILYWCFGTFTWGSVLAWLPLGKQFNCASFDVTALLCSARYEFFWQACCGWCWLLLDQQSWHVCHNNYADLYADSIPVWLRLKINIQFKCVYCNYLDTRPILE